MMDAVYIVDICSAGKSTRSRRTRAGTLAAQFHQLPIAPVIDGNNHHIFQIETIAASGFARAYQHHNNNSHGRNISNLIPIQCQPKNKTRSETSGSHPFESITTNRSNFDQPPKIYVFNAAALTKPNATQQLGADLVGMKIDIALISETKLKPKHTDACVNIEGYRLFRRDRVGRQGGGVAIYVSERYNASVYSNFNHPCLDSFEIIWVKIHTNNSLAFVGALYHPPRPTYDVSDLLDFIERAIEHISNDSPEALIIVGGDVNQLPETDLLVRTGLASIVHQPTRGNSCLDKIYVSIPCYSRIQVVTSTVKSDHKAVVASCDATAHPSPIQPRHYKCRLRSPSRNADLLKHLSTSALELTDGHMDLQDEFDSFYQESIKLLNKYYPEINIKLTSKDPDYMTPSIKAKLKIKNYLMRHRRIEEANQLASRIGLDIAKRNSTRLKHINSKTASKDMWRAVQKLTNRDHAEVIPPGVDAEVLNKHYAATSTDVKYICPLTKATVRGTDVPFTEIEVFNRLDKLKVTATGLDGLPAWVSQTRSTILFQTNHEAIEQLLNGKLGAVSMEACLHTTNTKSQDADRTLGLPPNLNNTGTIKIPGKDGRQNLFLSGLRKSSPNTLVPGSVRIQTRWLNNCCAHITSTYRQ